MKHRRWLVSLYPARWRARYGREFEAFLEDVRPGWREASNILWEAAKMRIVSTNWKMPVICAVAGAAIAAVISFRMPAQYTATAVVRVDPAEAKGLSDAELRRLTDGEALAVLSRVSLAELVNEENLYKSDRTDLPMELVVDRMRTRDLRVTPVYASGGRLEAFTVQFRYPDAAKAESVTRAFAKRMQSGDIRGMSGAVPLKMVQPPRLPDRGVPPNRVAIALVGTAAGLLLALIVAGVRRWPRIALCGALVGAVAFAAAYAIPERYTSQALIQFQPPEYAASVLPKVLSDDVLTRIITDANLYPAERRNGGLPAAIHRVHDRSLQIESVIGPSGLATSGFTRLRFTYTDRYKAQAALRETVMWLATIHYQQFPNHSPGPPFSPLGALTVYDPSSLAELHSWPNRPAIAFAGLVFGLLLGAAVPQFRRAGGPFAPGRPLAITARMDDPPPLEP